MAHPLIPTHHGSHALLRKRCRMVTVEEPWAAGELLVGLEHGRGLEPLAVPPHLELNSVARLEVVQECPQTRHAIDRRAIHRENHVAWDDRIARSIAHALQPCSTSCAVCWYAHHCGTLNSELPRHRTTQHIVGFNSQARRRVVPLF